LTFACLLSSGVLGADDLIHVVGRGETIYSLARLYQVTVDELMRANGITDPSRLSVGARLVIPVNRNVSPVQVSATTQTLTDYRVVRGDTFYSIARTHGVTVQRLQEINRFSSNHTLRAGDVIRVPARSASPMPSPTTAVTPPAPHSNNTAAATAPSGLYALRWPVTPRDITYMTGQLGVVVEGQRLEAVQSLTTGNVVSAGPWRKFGRVVIIETTGGYYYMYGGLESITVSVGDRITPGAELGRLGINAVSEKPHLFFMVFRNDDPIDPAAAPRAGNSSTNNSRS